MDVEMNVYPVCPYCGGKLSIRMNKPNKKKEILLLCETGNHCICESEFYKRDDNEFVSIDGCFKIKNIGHE